MANVAIEGAEAVWKGDSPRPLSGAIVSAKLARLTALDISAGGAANFPGIRTVRLKILSGGGTIYVEACGGAVS